VIDGKFAFVNNGEFTSNGKIALLREMALNKRQPTNKFFLTSFLEIERMNSNSALYYALFRPPVEHQVATASRLRVAHIFL
jgi:hypothetical protein